MKPPNVFLKENEWLFEDMVTGKYYILKKESAVDIELIIRSYGSRKNVPQSEKMRVKKAGQIFNEYSVVPIKFLIPVRGR